MYTPKSSIEWSVDFDWNVQGINLFDEKSKEWFRNNKGIFVKEYKINRWGDLQLLFSNGELLEILVDVSDSSECWRLFEYNSNREDFAATGRGIMLQPSEDF